MALDFNFTSEQKMLEDSVYKWAVSWLEPQMEHLYEVDEMPPTFSRSLEIWVSTESSLRKSTAVPLWDM